MTHCIEIEFSASLLPLFHPLFQQGVTVEVVTGESIRQTLIEQFGIPGDYISARISTLFLNSRAVDDAATAVISDRAVLALSGAMPGLVGATMRSGGFYAALRGAMTYQATDETAAARRGTITLKLFNLLLEELGPRLLARGILIDSGRWRRFLAELPAQLRAGAYRVDGRPLPVERLRSAADLPPGEGLVRLRVTFADEGA